MSWMEQFVYNPIRDIDTTFPAYKNVFPFLPENSKFTFSKFWELCLKDKLTSTTNWIILNAMAEAQRQNEDPENEFFIYCEWPGAKKVSL